MTTPEKERAICEAYRNRERTCDIVSRYKVSRKTVVNIAKRNDIPPRPQGRPRGDVTKQEAEQFARLIEQGYSQSTAASKIRRSVETVLLACEEHGIEIKPDRAAEQDTYAKMILGYNRGRRPDNDPFGLTERSLPAGGL